MFDKNGKLTPVTLISVGPCYILQKKNKEKDGYEALQVGFEKIEKKSKIGQTVDQGLAATGEPVVDHVHPNMMVLPEGPGPAEHVE